MAEEVAEGEILAMAVDEHTCLFKFEFAGGFIDVAGVGPHIEHVGDKHVVAAEVGDALHPAFDAQRRLLYRRAFHLLSSDGMQPSLLPLVEVTA